MGRGGAAGGRVQARVRWGSLAKPQSREGSAETRWGAEARREGVCRLGFGGVLSQSRKAAKVRWKLGGARRCGGGLEAQVRWGSLAKPQSREGSVEVRWARRCRREGVCRLGFGGVLSQSRKAAKVRWRSDGARRCGGRACAGSGSVGFSRKAAKPRRFGGNSVGRGGVGGGLEAQVRWGSLAKPQSREGSVEVRWGAEVPAGGRVQARVRWGSLAKPRRFGGNSVGRGGAAGWRVQAQVRWGSLAKPQSREGSVEVRWGAAGWRVQAQVRRGEVQWGAAARLLEDLTRRGRSPPG